MNYNGQSYQVSTMMKTRYDNYMTNRIDVIYAKNKIELS